MDYPRRSVHAPLEQERPVSSSWQTKAPAPRPRRPSRTSLHSASFKTRGHMGYISVRISKAYVRSLTLEAIALPASCHHTRCRFVQAYSTTYLTQSMLPPPTGRNTRWLSSRTFQSRTCIPSNTQRDALTIRNEPEKHQRDEVVGKAHEATPLIELRCGSHVLAMIRSLIWHWQAVASPGLTVRSRPPVTTRSLRHESKALISDW